MATWQLVLLVFVVLVPFALMTDFHPHRERLDARGRPLNRDWLRQVRRSPPAEEEPGEPSA